MGQRVLLSVFRFSGLVLVLGGLLLLGAWKIGEQILASAEPEVFATAPVQFLRGLCITWSVAGVVALVLVWSIRPDSGARAGREDRASAGVGGLTSMMPAFLFLLALLALASSGPLIDWWKSGHGLLERFGVWEALRGRPGDPLSLLAVVAVLFVPAVGTATMLSFLSGTATAAVFRVQGIRFVRIYSAWLVIHSALVLTSVYSSHLVHELSGPWLEELRSDEIEAAESSEEPLPPGALAYLEDWVPRSVSLTSSVATRAIWVSAGYAAWLPLLLVAARAGTRAAGRGTDGDGLSPT